MIGAIKRRWKSKKAKVLHKGNDLSSSSDSCPTSQRGFVDGPEDFEKMIKPPSPRQVHPVLDKADLKFHNLHHLLQQNNGNTNSHPHSYILQQPPSGKKKSSTLPSSEDGNGEKGSQDGCHFIRVNSGRIELVSKDSSKTNSSAADQSGNYSPCNTAAERFLNRHLKNDVRHSWCGSVVRPQKTPDAQQQSKRQSEDQYSGGGFRGALTSNNNNNRIYPQDDVTEGQTHQYHQLLAHTQANLQNDVVDGGGSGANTEHGESEETTNTGGTGLLSPLRERLAAIEELTTSLQSWQTTEKTEYEKCVSDLANQVSRAVALQQLMKSEVEKLQQRVVDLENHNKAMATMIIPTLMKLHDTTVGITDGPQLKSIEPAPMDESDCQRNLIKSQELSPSTSFDNNDLSRSYIINSSPIHTIGGEGPMSSQNASSKMKTICYEQQSITSDDNLKTFTTSQSGSLRRERNPVTTELQQPLLITASTPPSSRSPVKAPRTSRTTAIPKMNSSNGNITLSSSLSRSNSGRSNGQSQANNNQSTGVISLIETEPSVSLDQSQNQSGNVASLELSTSSCSSFTGTSNNSEMSSNVIVSNNGNNWNASRTSISSSGIPRMSSSATSSPVKTSRIPGSSQPQGPPTPKPARRNAATAAASAASDRSCSPQRNSRLPVRKTQFVPSTSSPSRNNQHPAATSKSLPSNSNTPFQSMSKSGPQGNKHSKSTFGFGSRKSTGLPSSNSAGANSTRTAGSGGVTTSLSKPGNKSNCPTTSSPSSNHTNLPESNRSGSSGSNSVSTTKPIKLVSATCAVVSGITKASGNGKDEGYSTMSSEALAEQEHLHHHQNNSLEKSSQRAGDIGSCKPPPVFTSSASFSLKSGNARVASLPKTNKIAGIGSPTTAIASPAEASSGANGNSIHKSNTFNTFREMGSEQRSRNQSQRSYKVCDRDDDEDAFDEIPRNNYSSAGSRLPVQEVITAHTSTRPFTSLPNSSSSASSSPSKGKPTCSSTPTKRTLKSSKDRVTTTRMMDGNIVRIVRGSPYSIRLGEESGDDMEDEEDPSSSTILWEDSDDSDILFLPLEVSASSAASSRTTLVPPPQSSGESRSYYSSWGRGSSSTATATTATCSTLEKGGSNTSINNSIGSTGGGDGGSGTYSKRAYPLRRTKGEKTVDILLVANGIGDNSSYNGSSNSTRNNKSKFSNKKGYGGGSGAEGITNETDQDNDGHIHLVNNPHGNDDHDNHETIDELEEKALIEKWMQLEEVRNEQVHGGEQWAWDWDGVERTYTRVLRNGIGRLREIPSELDQDDDDIDVDLILEESGLAASETDETDRVEERNALNETQQLNGSSATSMQMQIDSSTWTKSKAKKHSNKEASGKKMDESNVPNGTNSPEASPEKMRREGDSIVIVLEGECEDGPLIKSAEQDGVDERSRFCDENVSANGSGGKKKLGKNSHNMTINLDENEIVVTSCGEPNGEENDDGEDADGEDDPPPVIEFTPEFYRLANYGSNLSFSDNEAGSNGAQNGVLQSPKLMSCSQAGNNNNKSGPSSPARSPKKRKNRKHSMSSNATEVTLSIPQTLQTTVLSSTVQQMRTDDKISQTDFSGSSLENMSSVSSELSAEYRNCLDIIKKLVANADTDDGEEGGSSSGDIRATNSEGNSGAFNGVERKDAAGTSGVDAASYATTWISVPKGLPTVEVDRILEILSSSESEGVLSPSK